MKIMNYNNDQQSKKSLTINSRTHILAGFTSYQIGRDTYTTGGKSCWYWKPFQLPNACNVTYLRGEPTNAILLDKNKF